MDNKKYSTRIPSFLLQLSRQSKLLMLSENFVRREVCAQTERPVLMRSDGNLCERVSRSPHDGSRVITEHLVQVNRITKSCILASLDLRSVV